MPAASSGDLSAIEGRPAETQLTPEVATAPRTFASDEVHDYRAELAPGLWRVLVTQRGVDTVLEATVFSGANLSSGEGLSEGPVLGPFDSPTGRRGTEAFSIELERSGLVRLSIRPKRHSTSGSYSLAIELLTTSPGDDRARAERLATRAARSMATCASQEAREQYRLALELWPPDDPAGRARILGALAVLAGAADDNAEAAAQYRQALALWRSLGERENEATTLNRLGLIVDELGDSVAARRLLEQSLALWEELGDTEAGLSPRLNLCLMMQRQGDFAAALPCYESALGEARALGQSRRETLLLNNLAGVHWKLGTIDRALALYEEVLQRLDGASSEALRANVVSNRAQLYAELGETERALLDLGQALESFRRLELERSEAQTVAHLGTTFLDLGELDRAQVYLEQALPLLRTLDDSRNVAGALRALGLAQGGLGDWVTAIETFSEALSLSRSLDDRRGEATLLTLVGLAHTEAGSLPRAVAGLERAALRQRELGDRRQEGQALLWLSQAQHRLGATDAAAESLDRALALLRGVRDRAEEARALATLARHERDRGRIDEALRAVSSAVDLVEDLRTRAGGLRQRAAFLATRREIYELHVDLLMQRHRVQPTAGFDREAFAESERARSRALLDGFALDPSVDEPLRQEIRTATRRLAARVANQMAIGASELDVTKAATADREVAEALTALEALQAKARRVDRASDAIDDTVDAQEAARLLDPGTLLLEYLLGESRSFVWTIDREDFDVFELPGRPEIERLARQAHEDLSTLDLRTGRTSRRALEQLGRIVLEPVAARLAAARRVVVVADGALHYVPFAALPAPGLDEPLIAHHEVVQLPSASTLAQQRRRSAPTRASKTLAVLADPVFDHHDPRLADAIRQNQLDQVPGTAESATSTSARLRSALGPLSRLPATAREAAALAELVPEGDQRLVALGVDASRDRVVGGELASYRYVHFATHGLINARNPDLSGLVLAQVDAEGRERNGFLSLDDVSALQLSAELVVLSGCQTALGRELNGEGLVGLSRGFLTAGVPRLVASLWPVHDEATAHLMTLFYRGLLEDGMPPAQALADAQRRLRVESAWADPFFWSAFVLVGDWR
ncbi:MAG: CHAT domain-containing protein [Acidobacteriota bacterium]